LARLISASSLLSTYDKERKQWGGVKRRRTAGVSSWEGAASAGRDAPETFVFSSLRAFATAHSWECTRACAAESFRTDPNSQFSETGRPHTCSSVSAGAERTKTVRDRRRGAATATAARAGRAQGAATRFIDSAIVWSVCAAKRSVCAAKERNKQLGQVFFVCVSETWRGAAI
jgi:hypothetical protein